jgi:hypothetical protein
MTAPTTQIAALGSSLVTVFTRVRFHYPAYPQPGYGYPGHSDAPGYPGPSAYGYQGDAGYVVRQRFFGMFWPLFLAGSERLRHNRRMTDAAHNQHSETRRPSDRDRTVTTGPSRFQPARPEVLR